MPGHQGSAAQFIGNSIYSHAVLVDTGAFLALENPREDRHQVAKDCLDEIERHHLPLIVSLPTIFESYSRILYVVGERKARIFLHNIYDGSLNITRTTVEDEVAAMVMLEKFADPDISFVDAVNMALMIRLGIQVCFTFDHHFLRAGRTMIPPFHL